MNITSIPSSTTARRTARSLPRRGSRGVTLVEMLMVVAIAGILSLTAVPAISSIIESVRLSSASNVFLAELHLARSESIKRNSRVVLCKSPDGVACSSSGGWEQGWIIFHDANDNGFREVGELLIQRGEPLPDDYRLAGNKNVRHYISFDPRGATQPGTLTLCRRSIEPVAAREVVINFVGRPRIQKTSAAFCA